MLFGQIDARQDASFAAMAKLQEQVSSIVVQDPAVARVVSFAGATGGISGENSARMFIQLKPFGRRPPIQQVMAQLRSKVATVVGVNFFMQPVQDLTIGGRLSQAQYQYTLTDTNSDELNHWAPILLARMQRMKMLTDVASDQQIASPHLAITIDRDAIGRLGMPIAAVDQALYDAFGQEQVATIYSSTQQRKVVLEVQPQFQTNPSTLKSICIPATNGTQVSLLAIAKISNAVQPLTINHQGVFPAVTLFFNLAPGVALSQAVDAITKLGPALNMAAMVLGNFQGAAQAFQGSLSSTPILMPAAILVIYVVLGMLYESFIHPLTILSSLPSAGVGAVLMLMLSHHDLDMIALIGIILLIGIVKKNAIMMVYFALEAERHRGLNVVDPIHQACQQRFRPIMMTTVCADRRPSNGIRARARIGAPAASWNRHRGWASGLPIPYALHDACHLSLPGSPQ